MRSGQCIVNDLPSAIPSRKRVSILTWLNRFNQLLLILGIPGLFAIAFIDSAAVPLAGGPDALVLLLAWRRPAMVYLIVMAATVGSMLGALVMHGIGLKGGEKILSRFKPEKIAWAEKKIKEHGTWTVIAAILAPPPFPTKLMVLAAGVLRMSRLRFCLSVFAGRLLRYSLLGYLGVVFGNNAAQVLKDHYWAIFLALAGSVALLTFIWRLTFRRAKPVVSG
jgi:membrane protein DedA with SNARE-associated domain